jgi:hypothetical protein
MTPREQIEEALAAHGIADPVRVESHIRGCDLARPIFALLLQPGDRIDVWVRDRGSPGKYAAPVGENPLRLGIMIEGRHLETYEVTSELAVLCSIAATFPPGLVERVGGMGGGTQYLLPPDWLFNVERIR